MKKYLVDFSPYDYRIEIEAASPEEAVKKFKSMNHYDIMSNADQLDGLHTPLEPFLVSTETDDGNDYIYWNFDATTQGLSKDT